MIIISKLSSNFYKGDTEVLYGLMMRVNNSYNCHTKKPLTMYEHIRLINGTRTNENVTYINVSLFKL